MKKTILLLLVSIAFALSNTQSVHSQNLMTNGDLEAWTGSVPDGWNVYENISQETTIVYGGSSSANHVSASSTKDFQQVISVTGGLTYTIKYYYLDNDPNARSRIWSYWLSGGGTIPDNEPELRPNVYSSDNPSWQEFSVTLQAPASADGFRFEVRVYNQDGNTGGSVFYDDFSVEQAGVVTPVINQAYALSATAIDVIYNVDLTSVDPDDYSLTGSSSSTFSGATIDGSNAKLVHLTGASPAMTSDIILDNINDDGNGSDLDFYAGIMPVAYTNTNNPGGTMDDIHTATFSGIVSAKDPFNNVWVSDAAGQYNGVMIYSNSFDDLVNVGDNILFSAQRGPYNNLTELVNPNLISLISSGNTPYGPSAIPASDIAYTIAVNTNPAEAWEGQLVTISSLICDSISTIGTNYVCSSGGAVFYVGNNVADVPMTAGAEYVSVTGVIDWYWSGPFYRINPRTPADVVPLIIVEPTQLAIVSVNGDADPFENVDFEVVVQAQDEFGDPAFVDTDVNFTFTTNGGTSGLVDFTGGSTTTGTILAGTSEIVVTGVNMAPFGTNVTITATDDNPSGLDMGTSSPFNVLEFIIPDIIITEVMQNPDSVGDTSGEWFEVYNNTGIAVDMTGWVMKDLGTNSHTIAGPLTVPANSFAVLGNNGDPATNGGYTCDYVFPSSFALGNSDDEIILYLPDGITEIDRVEWDGGPIWPDPTGASMVYTGVVSEDNNDGTLWGQSLTAESSYGDPACDFGSPGSNGEFQVITEGFSLDLKVLLEGYYEVGVGMNNYFRANNILPLDHPYNPALPYYGNNSPVWLYAGTESTNYLPYSTTDWILVELWDGFASGKIQLAAVVENNGQVGSCNGSGRLSIKTDFFNPMYIAVYHLNHLGIISASGLTPVDGTVVSYDFTTGADKVMNGSLGYKELETNIWGMVAGDINGDGTVNITDKTNGWAPSAGAEGAYQGNNIYPDGQINNLDKNEVWAPNMGTSSQIPN